MLLPATVDVDEATGSEKDETLDDVDDDDVDGVDLGLRPGKLPNGGD